ncbi:MAG: HlyD family type I secretion periplasmic adaptor subunit [Methylococcaceae bacterium]|nr:HlyD family type I secretion periplasmic adaptor subunit [Methylococcaceae bacterium]
MNLKQTNANGVITDDRHFRRIGLVIVLSIFGGLGAWSALAPLSSAALAPGLITVENYRKTVQHLEGGIVKSILVRDGENVVKDQPLIILENTQPRALLEVLRGQYIVSLAKEARLLAQQNGLEEIRYPAELQEYENDKRTRDAMLMQSQTFLVRKQAYEGEINLYKGQIEQLRAKGVGLRAQKSSRDRVVSSLQSELQDFRDLLQKGYAEKQKVREFERNLAEREGEQGELMSNLAATELEISETKLKILQLQKEFQREVAKELSEVQSELFELRERLQSLQDTVQRTEIKAPEAGMVLGLQVHTLGAVIPPGGKILDIVPQNEELIVEAQVSPMDIDRVSVGQMAEIRFSAFKSRSVPKIEGKLIEVSADRLVDEKSENKNSYYLARVEITPQGLQDVIKSDLKLLPGMPAEVLINTGERTLLEYLIDPFSNLVARSFIED